MGRWIFVLLAGCGVEVASRGGANVAPDAPVQVTADAAIEVTIDAPPDARACAGGDASASDPSTGACYLFFRGPKTRAAAEADCQANASQLAIIKSAQSQAVVANLALGVDAFIGATDSVVEGTFLWPDGTPLTFTNFRAGEPNNANGSFQEDCLIIEGALNGSWDDRPCAPPPVGLGSYAYVCQF